MASLIPGFEYDIFISYRQKDNKYDGWVTGFVDNLKREIEATFKDDVSIYFDVNPHDGLLETHDVEDSLRDKLKCLVFIPIISRTYCDPKSFAWENEFRAFIGLASNDQFGLKVKIPNGNVANRVLPVRIHDLDAEDIQLCESLLGGFLRGVEFIYKEPGVNRSLGPDDDENKNLNKTRYRNQINKVANALREIITGLQAGNIATGISKPDSGLPWEEAKKGKRKTPVDVPIRSGRSKIISYIISALFILAFLGIYLFPKIINHDPLKKLDSFDNRISVAVMPFHNITNDTTWNIWEDGIQTNLISSLSNIEEIKVRQSESIGRLIEGNGITNYASLTPSVAGEIAQKLDARVFIYGTISQFGSIIRLNTQLMDSKTEEAIRSFQIDGAYEQIMKMTDSLTNMIKDALLISRLQKVGSVTLHDMHLNTTNSPEAYRCFLQGQIAFYKNDMSAAIDWYKQAMAIDSNLNVMGRIALAYLNNGDIVEGKEWALRHYGKLDKMNTQDKIWTRFVYASLFQTPKEIIECMDQLKDIDDKNPMTFFNSGDAYLNLQQYDKAIIELEKALDIFDSWGIKPTWIAYYAELGIAYHKAGMYKKEKKLYKRADRDFPDVPDIIDQKAYLSLTIGDIEEGNKYIDLWTEAMKDRSWTDVQIANYLASYVYEMADMPDKREENYRKALSLDPENPARMNALAYFLIDTDRNIMEGMDLAEKALGMNPESVGAIRCKGWALFKQGVNQESLVLLQKSWDLRMKNSVYNHHAYLELEGVKKAIAGN